MHKYVLKVKTTQQSEFVNITGQIENKLRETGDTEGVLTVYVPHTTAGIMINESADPAVIRDVEIWLQRAVPEDLNYQHLEGNSPAHIKSILIGSSVMIGFSDGRLLLGTWQGVFFGEFDGPRSREVYLLL